MSERSWISLEHALDLVIGYCAPELYMMANSHGGTPMFRAAVLRLLEADDLSWPQFLSEHAERLGLSDVGE